jgi:dTDP-4-amino-4,6-dideoxygalactose transaminase
MIPLFEPNIKGNAWNYTRSCLDTNWPGYEGRFVEKFEATIKEYTGSKHAVVCNTGTSALHISLLTSGVSGNHEIIVPTVTFFATIAAIKYTGAHPVFMDCDDYLNIDTKKLREFLKNECENTRAGLVNKKTNRHVKAILPVHVFGTPCDMNALLDIAEEFDIFIIEDAAEALGSFYPGKNEEMISCGGNKENNPKYNKAGIFSFSANKIITSGGGGVILTNNEELARKSRYLIKTAKDNSTYWIHNEIGYNFKMSNLHAALGLSQMELLPEFLKTKEENYNIYKEELQWIEGIDLLGYPENTISNTWLYCILVDEKKYGRSAEELMKILSKEKIQSRPLWLLNHLQKPCQHHEAYRIEKALKYYKMCLNIPCSTSLTEDQIYDVISVIKENRK